MRLRLVEATREVDGAAVKPLPGWIEAGSGSVRRTTLVGKPALVE
jgi:hypothetical protein